MSKKKNQSYYLINQFIQLRGKVSSHEIQEMLTNHDLPNSDRTVKRLILDLKMLGLDLEYDPQTRKYHFNASNSTDQTKLLGLMVAADFMQSVAAFPTNTLKYIDFDDRLVAKGSNFLPELFNAITNRKWIEVTYQRYETDQPKTHMLAPLFLKEFNYRWYLLAIIKGETTGRKNMPLLFGIDRIVHITQTGKNFPKDIFQSLPAYSAWSKENKSAPMDLFDDVIGVRFTDEAVEEVILKFNPEQAPFIKSQPWHSTQEIITDNNKEFTISICVRPNEDLLTLILSQHGNLEVVAPDALRKNIINLLKKSLGKYK